MKTGPSGPVFMAVASTEAGAQIALELSQHLVARNVLFCMASRGEAHLRPACGMRGEIGDGGGQCLG